MDTVAVLVLNYKRPTNITDHILPTLLNNPLVSTIVIAHGLQETVFGADHLADGEIHRDGKVLHVGDFHENQEVGCFRRWKLIAKLHELGILQERYIHSQDDDLVFDSDALSILLHAYKEGKGTLISGVPGRTYVGGSYRFDDCRGQCLIVLGRSIFTEVETICAALLRAKIPNEILKQDDICLSFLLLNRHYSVDCVFTELPAPSALSENKIAHWEKRNVAVRYFMTITSNQAASY
jgi:hypothetical protein